MEPPHRKQIDLWYPNVPTLDRTPEQPTEVEISLMHVRAARSIVVDYDFARDGYRIRMASVGQWEADDKVCDPKEVEVAFVPAWATGEPED